MRALLVIDMQKVSFTPETPRWDTEGVVDRINSLAAKFRERGEPVIFIQHDGTAEGQCVPGTEEWEMLDAVDVQDGDSIVAKTANDAFYKTELVEKLSELGIDHLLITGCATDFCVEATIQGAISRDYDLTIVSDAHTTADRPGISAKQVIDHYNWVWSNLAPTKGTVELKSSSQV